MYLFGSELDPATLGTLDSLEMYLSMSFSPLLVVELIVLEVVSKSFSSCLSSTSKSLFRMESASVSISFLLEVENKSLVPSLTSGLVKLL